MPSTLLNVVMLPQLFNELLTWVPIWINYIQRVHISYFFLVYKFIAKYNQYTNFKNSKITLKVGLFSPVSYISQQSNQKCPQFILALRLSDPQPTNQSKLNISFDDQSDKNRTNFLYPNQIYIILYLMNSLS